MPESWDRPLTRDALHRWIRSMLGVRIGRSAIVPGHSPPFDYICHAFFEGDPPPDHAAPHDPARCNGAHHAGPREPRPTETTADLVVWANRGGGKTFLGALATALDMVFKPGIEVRILGGSLEQSRRMFEHLRRFFAIPAMAALLAGRATERRLTLTTGSTVEILAQSHTSVRGARVQKLRCDEADLFDPEVWEAAQLTTRSARCGDVEVRGSIECLSTMHRPHGLMFRLVKQCAAGSRRLFRWGVIDALEACGPRHACRADRTHRADCPLLPECAGRAKHPGRDPGHITVADALAMKARVSLAAWEAEMLCLRPSRGHAVLPEFDPALHVVRRIPDEGLLWLGAVDFGFRADTVILWAGLDADGTLWVAHEHCRAQTLLEDHIRTVLDTPARLGLPAPAWIGADPAGRQRREQTGISNIDVMRAAGLVVRSRTMGLAEGIMLLRARLRPASGPPRLLIHQRCARLIESMERYHYPDADPESMSPVKDGHDHAVDALRYLIQCLDRPYRFEPSRYR